MESQYRFSFQIIDFLGSQEVATIKKYFRSFGGWPVLKGAAWNQNNINWVDVNTKFYKNGFFSRGIITTEIALNSLNTSQYNIRVSQIFVPNFQITFK